MAVIIGGRQFWLWRAVDDQGEVLDLLVQRRRDKAAAMKLMRKLLKKQGLRKNNRAENRISRPDGGSARCSASRAPAPRRNSSQPAPPCTTLSTSNAISRQRNHTACSVPRR
jgi:hypothetical protein